MQTPLENIPTSKKTNSTINNCVSVCNVIASCQEGSSAASSREQSKLSSICIRLLDPASTGAFITRQTMKKLGMKGGKTHLQLSIINGTEVTTTQKVAGH